MARQPRSVKEGLRMARKKKRDPKSVVRKGEQVGTRRTAPYKKKIQGRSYSPKTALKIAGAHAVGTIGRGAKDLAGRARAGIRMAKGRRMGTTTTRKRK